MSNCHLIISECKCIDSDMRQVLISNFQFQKQKQKQKNEKICETNLMYADDVNVDWKMEDEKTAYYSFLFNFFFSFTWALDNGRITFLFGRERASKFLLVIFSERKAHFHFSIFLLI